MVALPSATFQYVTTVPEEGTGASPWTMESRELFKSTDSQFDQTRLVGWKPLLYINDAGMPPNPSPSTPAVLRSELRLVATDKKYASQESASYFFDKALFNFLRPGDVFHMVQTDCGFGASAIRQGKLLFAVGQVTAVPLGSGIAARVPIDLLQDAQEVFRRRAPQFKFPELPIELRSGDRSHILYRGTAQVDGYRVKIERCIETCDGASSECASISLDRACDGCCQRHCPVAQNGLTPRLSGSTTGRNTAEKPPGELRNREKLVPALLRSASGELLPS